MPPGTRVRFFAPDPAIAEAVTGYNAYACTSDEARVDVFLPTMMLMTILIDAGPVTAEIGRHRFAPMPQVALHGTLTRPLRATTHGGIMIGVGLSAIGWARIGRRTAADLHNRVVPVGGLLGHATGERLVAGLNSAEDDVGIKTALDEVLLPLLRTPHPAEPLIAAFAQIVAGDGNPTITAAADQLGITSAALRRLALRYFGLAHKVLLRRARLLRSFLRQTGLDGAGRHGEIDPSYFDQAHYLRDAQAFLGTTPRRFLEQPTVFLLASVAARAAALGAPAQVLHADAAWRAASA